MLEAATNELKDKQDKIGFLNQELQQQKQSNVEKALQHEKSFNSLKASETQIAKLQDQINEANAHTAELESENNKLHQLVVEDEQVR